MARSVNEAKVIGNLGSDPVMFYFPDQTAKATLDIATTDSWRDKSSGEQRESTEWHRVCVYGRDAEFIAEFVKKGHRVYCNGKMETRKWEDNDGITRYTTEIAVRYPKGEFMLLTNKASPQDPPL